MGNEFKAYYEEYLGIQNGEYLDDIFICRSKYRDIPINKHYCYKMIATVYEGKKVLSCSEEYSEKDIRDMQDMIDFSVLQDFVMAEALQGSDEPQFYLYRMQLEHRTECSVKANRKLPDGRDIEFIYLAKWKKYVAAIGEELLGYCKVSDVINGFGNIVVWVDEKYRKLGIATQLLNLVLEQCEKDGIIPDYIVKMDNKASIRLAKNAGFEIVQKEFVYREIV